MDETILVYCVWPDSEPTKLLHHPKQMTSKDDIKGLVSLSSFVHAFTLPQTEIQRVFYSKISEYGGKRLHLVT
jgi:hypothetical protein